MTPDDETPDARESALGAQKTETPKTETPGGLQPANEQSDKKVGARDRHWLDDAGNGEGLPPIYGALDLGTNNCRLLLARPTRRGFRVIDSFSKIIRLGEGVSQTGTLSPAAMQRTYDALKVCAGKFQKHDVKRSRLVATQACRVAANGPSFIEEVRQRFAMPIEILTPETEAKLAVSGCATLIDPSVDYVLVFDIGGGSSEIVWLDLTNDGVRSGGPQGRPDAERAIMAWTSLPVGVVTLAEHFGGRHVTAESFEAMVNSVYGLIVPFEAQHKFSERLKSARAHFLGTSGTVTTIAGVLLDLKRYDRNRVDGLWLKSGDIARVRFLGH